MTTKETLHERDSESTAHLASIPILSLARTGRYNQRVQLPAITSRRVLCKLHLA